MQFLGLDFKPLTRSDQPLLEPFFRSHPQRLACYTFASQVASAEIRSSYWTFLCPDTLLISQLQQDQSRVILQPLGPFPKKSQESLINALKAAQTMIVNVSDSFIREYPDFCSQFHLEDDQKMDNFLYRAEDLATLQGRKYAKKRNLISQAENQYQWNLAPLTPQCAQSCIKILMEIGTKENQAKSLQEELKSLEFTLKHFPALKQKGYKIMVEGTLAAFTIYEQLNPLTAVIHFEKADRHDKGLYQLINREVAKIILKEGYELINREEDLGDPAIHQAKMSYFPVEMVRSFEMRLK